MEQAANWYVAWDRLNAENDQETDVSRLKAENDDPETDAPPLISFDDDPPPAKSVDRSDSDNRTRPSVFDSELRVSEDEEDPDDGIQFAACMERSGTCMVFLLASIGMVFVSILIAQHPGNGTREYSGMYRFESWDAYMRNSTDCSPNSSVLVYNRLEAIGEAFACTTFLKFEEVPPCACFIRASNGSKFYILNPILLETQSPPYVLVYDSLAVFSNKTFSSQLPSMMSFRNTSGTVLEVDFVVTEDAELSNFFRRTFEFLSKTKLS